MKRLHEIIMDSQVDLLLEKEKAHLFEMIPDLQTLTFEMSGTKDLWEHSKTVCYKVPSGPVLRWAALFHDIGKPVVFRTSKGSTFPNHAMVGAEIWIDNSSRFHKILTKKQRLQVERLIRYHMEVLLYTPRWNDRAVRNLALRCEGDLPMLIMLAKADGGDVENLNQLNRRISQLKGSVS